MKRKIHIVIMALFIFALTLGAYGCVLSNREFPPLPTVTAIRVTKAPDKTEYFEGEFFDVTGMVVSATWSDGTVENNVVESREFSFYEQPLTLTDTEIEISYREAKTTIAITVRQDAITSLVVNTAPTRTKFFADEGAIDFSGLSLTATYASGKIENVMHGYTVANVDLTTNPTSVRVSYKDKYVDIPITVITGVENKFEAERFAVKGGATIQETFLQMHNTPGSGYTFVFSSNIDTVAKFRFNLGGNEKAYNFGNSHIVRVNETEYNVSVEVGAHAESWGDYLILTCNVNAGINTLTITNKGESTTATTVTAANVDYITVITDATVAESRQYIVAGTSTYSLAGWNEIFPNAIATVDEQDDTKLVITLKDGATTNITAADGVSPLDGMLDFSLWRGVTIGGNGTLNVTYSNAQDGINAFNFTVEEGATVNLTGNSASNEKSAVKVYENLTINGTFNVSNFQYGQAITKDQPTKIVTTVGANGHYSITGVQNGIYAWSSTKQYPAINVAGRLSVNASNNAIYLAKAADVYFTGTSQITLVGASGYGIYNSNGSIYVRDSANVSIDSGNSGIYAARNIIIANGDDLANTTQNNASLTVMANANVIQSASTNSSFIFNTTGKVLIKSKTTGSYTGIQISKASSIRLVIKCADMTIEDVGYAIGSWVSLTNASTYSTYDYTSEGCAKLKVKNCDTITNSGYNNAIAFGAFTSSTVEVISE